MEYCKTQKRGSRATCTGLRKGHAGEHHFVVLYPDVEKAPKPVNRNTFEFKLAVLLSAILEEPQDDVENPHPVRLEQARMLGICWSSAQSSILGAAREILNIKQGHCVRCEERPCPICGAKAIERLPLPV